MAGKQKAAGRKPDFFVFASAGEGKPNIRVGAGWKHGKGEGINLMLDALPMNGTLTLFPPREDTESEDAA